MGKSLFPFAGPGCGCNVTTEGSAEAETERDGGSAGEVIAMPALLVTAGVAAAASIGRSVAEEVPCESPRSFCASKEKRAWPCAGAAARAAAMRAAYDAGRSSSLRRE